MKKLICILLFLILLSGCALLEAPAPAEPNLEDLVYTGCDKTFAWKDSDGNSHNVQITLPALRPLGEFAENYNASLESSFGYIFSDIESDMENGNPPYLLSVSYDAWVRDGLLTILFTQENAYEELSYEVAVFDPEAQTQLTAADLCERLLGMSYSEFLLAGSKFMTQEYRDSYHKSGMTYEEQEAFDACEGAISHELGMLLDRQLFLSEAGEIMFLYPRIRPTEDWYAGIDSDAAIEAVDPDKFLSPMEEEKAMQWLLSLQPSGMGGDAETFSYILQNAFYGDPEGFAAGLAAMDEEQRGYAIDNLLYGLWDEDKPPFRDTCVELLARESLSEELKEIFYLLLDRAI